MWVHPEYQNRERHEELADRLARAERSGNVGLAGRIKQSILDLFSEEWAAFGPREPRRGIRVLEHYTAAAITAAALKQEWLIDQAMELVGIRINNAASDRTTGSDVIDINRAAAPGASAVTIFTTQANRPTSAAASTGDWTIGFPDGLRAYVAGDVLSYDIDTASTGGTGKTRLTMAIALRYN